MNLTVSSRMRGGTKLRVPISKDIYQSINQNEDDKPKKWHEAKENETPRQIVASQCPSVKVQDFITANSKRFPDLQPGSRLRKGTRVRLPRPKNEAATTPDEIYRESCLAWEDDPEVHVILFEIYYLLDF